jgi:hypothetical protein
MGHNCHKCGKKFKRKEYLIKHLNKKNKCDQEIIVKPDEIIKEEIKDKIKEEKSNDNEINAINLHKYMEQNKCIYCQKEFSRKYSVMYHIKNNCKKVKEINDTKLKIFNELKEKEKKINELEEENKKLKESVIFKNNNENTYLHEKIIEMQKMINELKNNTIISNSISSVNANNTLSNNTLSNNTLINNSNNKIQNIQLNNYNGFGMPPLLEEEILPILKRGFQAPVELTKLVHFNPKYPEFHNVYIYKINEKHAMIYKDDNWKLIDKNNLVDDIYEHKRDYIISNLDTFIDKLDKFKIKALKRWLNTPDEDEGVKNTKEDIKKLLYDYRHMVIEKKKELENFKKKNKEIINIKVKKIKRKKVLTDSESESDSNSDSEKGIYSYDSCNSSKL